MCIKRRLQECSTAILSFTLPSVYYREQEYQFFLAVNEPEANYVSLPSWIHEFFNVVAQFLSCITPYLNPWSIIHLVSKWNQVNQPDQEMKPNWYDDGLIWARLEWQGRQLPREIGPRLIFIEIRCLRADWLELEKNADLAATLKKVQTLAKIPSPGLNRACGKWQISGPNYLMIKSQ